MRSLRHVVVFTLLLGSTYWSSSQAQSPHQFSMFVDHEVNGTQMTVWCLVRPSFVKPGDAVSGWVRSGPYAKRAFHAEHTSARALLAFAFRGQAERVLWDSPRADSSYDVEVIVPSESDTLLPLLVQHTVTAGLAVTAEWKNLETNVVLLQRDSTRPCAFTGPDAGSTLRAEFGRGRVSLYASHVNPEALATALQDRLKLIVLDETHLKQTADVCVDYVDGDWQSLQGSLGSLGLKLTRARRITTILMIRDL